MVPLFNNISIEKINTNFFDSNAVNSATVLINETVISSECSEISSVTSKESSYFEIEMDKICLEETEQFLLFESTLEGKLKKNLIGDSKFSEKFVVIRATCKIWAYIKRLKQQRSSYIFHDCCEKQNSNTRRTHLY